MSTGTVSAIPPGSMEPLSGNRRTIGMALLVSSVLVLYLGATNGWRQGALFLVGLSAGVILYHAAFGFTSAWREVVNTGRSAGLRAQMVMLGITVLVFTPLISIGEFGGISLRGSVAPVNLAVVCGAFLFGIGMQLGGGCASGTLYTAGGGNARMLVTLVAFIAGSVIGTWHWSAWQGAPGIAPFSMSTNFGVLPAILVSLGLFALVWVVASKVERRKRGEVESYWKTDTPGSWLKGPWPVVAGAIALAGVNIATLLLAGRPWGVTSAFALWGAKTARNLGIDVTAWDYWQRPGPLSSLDQSIFSDVTSVMNIGIMLGALLAAGLAVKFAPNFRLPMRSILAAVIGGLLLGYGARIAFGCNIGAYFGGISSTSLHGWLWFVAAFAGSSLGTRVRPMFGLS